MLVTRVALSFCVVSSLAASTSVATQPALPFEALGKALIAAADATKPKDAPVERDFFERIEPLHDVVRLGAFELWLPRKVAKPDATVTDASPTDPVRDFASALVKLQREWFERVGIDGEPLVADREATETLLRFAGRLRKSPFVEPDIDTLGARKLVEVALLGEAQADHAHRSVILIAPTRAHFVAVLGAAGSMLSAQRSFLWSDEAGHAGSVALQPNRVMIAMNAESDAKSDSMRDDVLAPEVRLQTVVHAAAHMLSQRYIPKAPSWFREGLAIVDTIATVKFDDTLCTGYPASPMSSGYTMQSGTEGVFMWAARQASPFREGASAHWFVPELREARTRDGFKTFDLDNLRNWMPLSMPLLTEGFEVPHGVAVAPSGLKKGFAELFRAYCASFVHWLDTEQPARPRVLDRLVSELHRLPPVNDKDKPGPLYKLAHSLSGRTIGESLNPDTDLEAGFFAWLGP